jgi:hypothetical protein
MDKKAILKVYPSKFWHGDVAIVGNKEGLTKLKEAIETALLGELGGALVQETDGCEYNVFPKMYDEDLLDEKWMEFPSHYDDGEITQEEEEFLSKFLLSQKDSIEV